MNNKWTIRDRISEFFSEYCEWIFMTFILIILIVLVIGNLITSFYDSDAVVTAIGNEGVTVEYRDRKGRLRSDFLETSNEYYIGDEIIVHVDEWKYRSKKEIFLSDEDKE